MTFNIFDKTIEFAQRNYFVDVEDKIPIFLCSIGGHIFNALNKCSRCDFDPDSPLVDEEEDFIIVEYVLQKKQSKEVNPEQLKYPTIDNICRGDPSDTPLQPSLLERESTATGRVKTVPMDLLSWQRKLSPSKDDAPPMPSLLSPSYQDAKKFCYAPLAAASTTAQAKAPNKTKSTTTDDLLQITQQEAW